MEQFLLDFMSEYADFGIILVNIIVMKKFPTFKYILKKFYTFKYILS